MLTARGEQRLGALVHRSGVGVERDLMVHAAQRDGLAYDSALAPARRGAPRDVHYLWLVLEGVVTVDGQVHCAPVALAMAEHAFTGAHGTRAHHLTTIGRRFEALELHVRGDAYLARVTGPRVLELDPRTWSEAKALVAALLGDAPLAPGLTRLLESLRDLGLLEARHLSRLGVPPTALAGRVWDTLARVYGPAARIKALSSLGEVVLSQSSVERAVNRLYADYLLPGDGWRDMISHLRLSLAALFLSDPEVSVAEVARTVGFNHPQALTNAFQRAKLPPPSEIRAVHARRAATALFAQRHCHPRVRFS